LNKKKRLFEISGIISIGNGKVFVEDHTSKQERHVRAYTVRQATWQFARRFEKKFNTSIFIGDAHIIEIEGENEE